MKPCLFSFFAFVMAPSHIITLSLENQHIQFRYSLTQQQKSKEATTADNSYHHQTMHRITIKSSQRALQSLRTATSAASRPAAASLSTAAAGGDNPFSIQGKFRDGRASYLDMSATTPLDPRVLDKMMPYFVSVKECDYVLDIWLDQARLL